MTLEDIVKPLATRLASLVKNMRFSQGVAQVWYSVVYKDIPNYLMLSANCNYTALAEHRLKFSEGRLNLTNWDAAKFETELLKNPLFVLAAFIGMTESDARLYNDSPSVARSADVYEGMAGEESVFDWNQDLIVKHVVLIRAHVGVAATDFQTNSLYRYTSPYRYALKNQAGGLIINVSSVSSLVLDRQLSAITSHRRALPAYLAEFSIPPELKDSRDVGSTLWSAEQGLENSALIAQEALKHLEAAVICGARLVVFPELTIDQSVLDKIRTWLLSNDSSIAMVVCGSFHEICALGVVRNVSRTLDGQGNEIVGLKHEKIVPVSLPGISESINTGKTISILASPIGLIAILICLDFGQSLPGAQLQLGLLPIQIWIVPSLGRNTHAQKIAAENLLLHSRGTVVVCNQGPAVICGENMAGDQKAEPERWQQSQSFVMQSSIQGKPQQLVPDMSMPVHSGGMFFEIPIFATALEPSKPNLEALTQRS